MPTPKAYIVAQFNIPDVGAYKASGYMQRAERAVAAHGGRFLVRGGVPTPLDGSPADTRTAILEFPSRAAAQTFWDSPDYAPAKALRTTLSTATATLLSGVEPPAA